MPMIPDSYNLSAASASWPDYLAALHDHFANTSSRFQVIEVEDDTGGSGDYGFIVAPLSGAGWEIGLRWDASESDARIMVDPEGDLGDPLAPTGSASASPDRPCSDAGATYGTGLLVGEFDDTFYVLIKNGANDAVSYVIFGGKLLIPFLANDPSDREISGIGQMNGRPEIAGDDSDTVGFPYLLNAYQAERTHSLFRVGPTTWKRGGAASHARLDAGDISEGLSSGLARPCPIVVTTAHVPEGSQRLGFLRYNYLWHTVRPELTVIQGNQGEGLLFVWQNQVVPWDPTVSPV